MSFDVTCKARALLKIAVNLLLLLASSRSVHAALTIEQLLNEPYFDADASDIDAVRKGGFGVAKIHEVSDREIAVVIACLVKGTREQALAPFLGDSLPADEKLLQDQRPIDTAAHAPSFAAISLGSIPLRLPQMA